MNGKQRVDGQPEPAGNGGAPTHCHLEPTGPWYLPDMHATPFVGWPGLHVRIARSWS